MIRTFAAAVLALLIIAAPARAEDLLPPSQRSTFEFTQTTTSNTSNEVKPEPEQEESPHIISGILLFLVCVALYLLPSLIAGKREHHQGWAIFVLNLLAGWTAIGWLLALVWSCTATPGAPHSNRKAA
jgi:hypothetical protein